jgi:hypothetical protein
MLFRYCRAAVVWMCLTAGRLMQFKTQDALGCAGRHDGRGSLSGETASQTWLGPQRSKRNTDCACRIDLIVA